MRKLMDDEFINDLTFYIPDANLKLPDPHLVQYYKDEKNRVIYIDDEVSDYYMIEKEKLILRWNQEDKDIPVEERVPIKLFIYSPGGDGDACLSFINIMQLSKTPVKAFCIGQAMSAAAMIFISAPKGNRYILKNATILIHQGSGTMAGNAQMVMDQSEDYKHFLEVMKEITLSNTNITKQLYNKMAKKEWYIYSDKAIELGCADHIITSIDELF